uniref:Uncharacterized protein n=1 Tax=Anguilla anguilla TaxID=7936 RepID=A0A0E9UY32_ANGAN
MHIDTVYVLVDRMFFFHVYEARRPFFFK